MKVFIFDLLAYGKHFDQYKATKYLPYPLANDHYDREVAAQTYEDHLRAVSYTHLTLPTNREV